MRTLLNLSFLLLIGLSISCSQNATSSGEAETKNVTTENLPKLLDRAERIRLDKEWERVQNQYSKLTEKIRKGKEVEKSKLQLAQLFTQEARVTGEHGHYYPAALALTNEVLNVDSLSTDIKFLTLSTKASVQLSQHDFKDALAVGQEAVKINPHNAQIHGVLTDAYVELGDYKKAVEMADKMMSIRPDLRSYSRVSYLREIHGRPEEAIKAMQMAVTAGYPGYEETAWAALQLGHLYEQYGKLEEAEDIYKQVLDMRTDYPFAIAALGDLAMEQKDYEKAEKLLKDACAIIPEVGFYESLAKLYKKTDRKAEAEKLTKEVLVMLEDDIKSGHNMNLEYAAVYSDLMGEQDKALTYLLKEYKIRPENIDVNQALASLYHEKGEKEKAKEHLAKALVTDSKNPALMSLKAAL